MEYYLKVTYWKDMGKIPLIKPFINQIEIEKSFCSVLNMTMFKIKPYGSKEWLNEKVHKLNILEIWNLDSIRDYNSREVKNFMKKNGFDRNTHENFKTGDIIDFYTGFNNDIRARAKIKGISGDDLYVYNDCYRFPIQDDEKRKIRKVL